MGKVQPMLVPNLSYLKRILHRGMSGVDVKKVQQRLDTLNTVHKFCPVPTLKDSGAFDQTTHKFVTFFQIYADICADGWVDKVTADAIEDFFQAIAQTYAIPITDIRNPIWDRY